MIVIIFKILLCVILVMELGCMAISIEAIYKELSHVDPDEYNSYLDEFDRFFIRYRKYVSEDTKLTPEERHLAVELVAKCESQLNEIKKT